MEETSTIESALVDSRFKARGLAGKCISVDSKSRRVGIRTCADIVEQQLRIVEQATDRLVEIQILNLCLQPVGGVASAGVALEVADCKSAPRWILDGDSIRLAPPTTGGPLPDLFVAVQQHTGVEGSPLALEPRRLDESDYWELTNVSPRGPEYPTSGFVKVTNEAELYDAVDHASIGSVIDIVPSAKIELTECRFVDRPEPEPDTWGARLLITDRVTLRSGGKHQGRRHIHYGTDNALLRYNPTDPRCLEPENPTAIEVIGNHARITGIHLWGMEHSSEKTFGIFVNAMPIEAFPLGCDRPPVPNRVDIDHMDIEQWKGAGVVAYAWSAREYIEGTAPQWNEDTFQWEGGSWDPLQTCRCGAEMVEPVSVFVTRNYLHHNTEPYGYGVLASTDGHATILGNTFLHNRHAVATTGTTGARYEAIGNLVQSHGEGHEQDFDVHGSAGCAGGARGGVAGERIDVVKNTFLGDNRTNFYLRGAPCLGARFADNVTRQQEDDGITELENWNQAVRTDNCPWEGSVGLEQQNNRFSIKDPTRDLVVGDFNGDGVDDLFMATGAAHYVSFGGVATWQFRALGTEMVSDLLFGDFDADKRTDVVRNAPSGVGIEVRWGGEGEWIPMRSDVRLPDLLAGDFDGNGRDDLLWTTGTEWRAATTSAVFTLLRTDSRRARDLRVARLDTDATADVFGIVGSSFAYHPSGGMSTVIMGPAGDASIALLSIADADGNGRGDVVLSRSLGLGIFEILVSREGAAPFEPWTFSGSGKRGAIGRFLTSTRATALYWDSLALRAVNLGQPDQYHGYFEMF